MVIPVGYQNVNVSLSDRIYVHKQIYALALVC